MVKCFLLYLQTNFILGWARHSSQILPHSTLQTNWYIINSMKSLLMMFIRPNIWSKIYDRFDGIRSKIQFCLKKGFKKGMKYFLIAMIAGIVIKIVHVVFYEPICVKILTFIVHDFLVFKLEAYGFIHKALNIIKNYLSDKTLSRKQQLKILLQLIFWFSNGSLSNFYTSLTFI